MAIREKGAAMQIDELAWKTGVSHGTLASVLLELELKNLIQVMPGRAYRLL